MREIKFRAWDQNEQCWINGFSIHNSGLFSDMIKGEIDKSGVCIANCNWQKLNELPNIEIMQYTGLKDCDGTEIYEGDIVRIWGGEHWYGYWEVDIKGEVVFEASSFGVKSNGIFYPFNIALEPYDYQIKVLGNKYEK